MPISIKEFNGNKFKQEYGLSNRILEFLKKEKKAYTMKEITKILLGDEKFFYKVSPRMSNLSAKGKLIHKRPYFAYNFKNE